MENPTNRDDLGVPLFLETSTSCQRAQDILQKTLALCEDGNSCFPAIHLSEPLNMHPVDMQKL